MRLAVCALLLVGCAEAPAELALPVAQEALRQPPALLGRWQIRPTGLLPFEDDRWLLRGDGVAEHVEHDALGERHDELCRWGVRDDRFELDCPGGQLRGAYQLDDGELRLAPMRRGTPAEEERLAEVNVPLGRTLLAAWVGKREHRGVGTPRFDGRWHVGEETILRLFDDYTIRGDVTYDLGGDFIRCQWVYGLCRMDGEFLRCGRDAPVGDPDAIAAQVIAVAMDPETGLPRFEGASLSTSLWERSP